MNAPRAARRLLLLAAAALGLSCGGDRPGGPIEPGPVGPGPGTLRIEATQVPAGAGGLLLAIEGGPVSDVAAVGSYEVYHRADGEARTVVLVRGSLAAGGIVRITVPDRDRNYTLAVLDAAAGQAGGYARQPADAFVLDVARTD